MKMNLLGYEKYYLGGESFAPVVHLTRDEAIAIRNGEDAGTAGHLYANALSNAINTVQEGETQYILIGVTR